MIDEGKHNILGVLVNAIDYDSAVSRIISSAKSRSRMAVSALAVHGVMTGALDARHRYRLNRLDLVVPDGQPVRWAMNRLYATHLKDRVYGPTLMLKICEQASIENLSIYLYGSTNAVLEALRAKLQMHIPGLRIAGVQESRFRRLSENENEDAIRQIRSSGASITFVGLGCPRQEVWVYEHRESLEMPVVAVGAAFDFHAGSLRQASPILQKMGLEWLFRLINEPLRLWKRYVLLNPLFIALFIFQKTKIFSIDPFPASRPEHNLNYG